MTRSISSHNTLEVMEMASWETIVPGEKWATLFRSFRESAFRLEALQTYAAPSESAALNAFLKGDMQNKQWNQGWCDLVSSNTQAGRSMSRVHLVDLPLSDYMRFEVECAYTHTGKAGEHIRLVDRGALSPQLQALLKEDFWLFDNSRVMIQDYSEAGTLLQARITEEPAVVRHYMAAKEQALRWSTPFKDFYKKVTGKELD